MTPQRARRLLLIAFALSLLIHVIVMSGVRSPFGPYKDETQTVVSIQHVRALRLTRQPTPPPPTPTPSPQPSARASAPPKPHPRPSGANASGGGKANATEAPSPLTATPPPTTKPSPTPNCATSDTTALIAQTPPPPDIAPDARGDATNGSTMVRVSVDATGAVAQATVVQSSGNPSLDLVAVTMARAARYTPATHACKPIASNYMFKAKFSAW